MDMAEEAKNILKEADRTKAKETMVELLLRFYMPLAEIYDREEASDRAIILLKSFIKMGEKELK